MKGRYKNYAWTLTGETRPGGGYPWDTIKASILMDIRDELQALNEVMRCQNVAKGFRALAAIAARDERTFKRRVDEAVRKRLKRAE